MPPPNEGPPDLDEILKKLQQKIAGLFGMRPRPVPSAPQGMGAAVGGGLIFIILLIIAVWLASGFYIVEEGRRGVVLRLGRFLEVGRTLVVLLSPLAIVRRHRDGGGRGAVKRRRAARLSEWRLPSPGARPG